MKGERSVSFCKYRVLDKCTKNNMPCTFDEECFEPQDEPARRELNCLKCHYRHPDNGNCTAVGGFCTAVQAAHCPLIPELLERAEAAEARAAKAEKERSAAIEDLRACYASPCDTCKHASAPPKWCEVNCESCQWENCRCRNCTLSDSQWEWRGPQGG